MLAMGHPRDIGQKLILFDGTCNVCNSTVLFIIDHDPGERFVFAPLDSDLGRAELALAGLDANALDSVVLIDGERAFTHSSAGLEIARHLSGPWPALRVLTLVPRPLRDAAYRAFAQRRYRWFGRGEQCRVPSPALLRRFVA